MALVNPQQVVVGGLNPSMSAASGGGDEFVPGDDIFLFITNGGGSPITATIVTPGTVQGQPVGDVAVVVTNGQSRLVGPFPAGDFANPADGKADITWSATTSVTFAVCRL